MFGFVQVAGASALSMPILVTEQYPKALGATNQLIKESLPAGTQTQSKLLFSMCGKGLLCSLANLTLC